MADFSPDKVKAQLERILAGSEFLGSRQRCRFLRYVVEQTLNGRSGIIKQYTVGVESLGYGADFDPQSNPSVRIEARRLRRSLDLYYNGEGVDDPVRIEIPKGSYIPVFRNNRVFLEPSGNAYSTPVIYDDEPLLSGYVSEENLELLAGSASTVVARRGNGRAVLIAENPNFRAFWHGTNRLFINAVFFGSLIRVP